MSFLCRRKKRKFLSFILSVFLVLTFAGKVLAFQKPNIHIGSLEIHPFAAVKQTYDSNIFLEPGGEEDDDLITNVTLGVGAQMPLLPARGEDFMLKTSYQANIIEYWDNDEPSRVNHTLKGLLDFTFTNDLRLRIEDNFKKTADQPDSERTTLDERWRNIFDTTLAYNREKIRLLSGYRNIRDDYDDVDNLDKTDNMFTGAVFYQIYPKTSIFTEYNYGIITYDTNRTNSDSDYYQVRLGIEGKLLQKLTGTLKTGYRDVNYDESDKDDFSSISVFTNMKYTVTERTMVNIYAERTSEESSYSTNSHYEANNIGIKLDHQLMERLWLNGGGFLQRNQYPDETTEGSDTKKRKDTLRGVAAGLKYEIREWLHINTDYEFKQRDSNFRTFDYDDHRISAGVSATF